MRPLALPLLAALLVVPLAHAQPPGHEVVRATLALTHVGAEPQAPVPFRIAVENLATERIVVRFELVDPAPQGWQVVPPAPVALPGPEDHDNRTKTAILYVRTPFENGYVQESALIRLRAIATSAEDPSAVLQEVPLSVTVNARGWYVPGPAPALALLVVAALAVTLRRGA